MRRVSSRPFLHHHLHPPLPPQPESVFGGSPFAQCHGEVRRAEGSSRWVVCSIQSHKMSGLTVIADKPAAAATQGAANLYSTILTQTHRHRHTDRQRHTHTDTQSHKHRHRDRQRQIHSHTRKDTHTHKVCFKREFVFQSFKVCLFQYCVRVFQLWPGRVCWVAAGQ